ncbi:hypothetical protein [Sphingomonas sp.]|uniref:hypothetical protein n=1 Tax=Sphingomonas sp. TaxID=28214 RepID=UPI002EDB1A6C
MRKTVLATALLLIAGEAHAAEKRKPEPGWKCALENRGPFGVISSAFEISKRPQALPAHLSWRDGDGTFRNPWLSAAWFRKPDGSYSLDHGYVNITRHIWKGRVGKGPRAQKLRLEIRTTLDQPRFRAAALASAVQRSGGPFHMQLYWHDLAAFARGAPRLYLVARNTKSEMVDHVEIDREIFDRAAPHVEAAMRKIEEIYAAPAKHCTHFDDLRETDIVVTS